MTLRELRPCHKVQPTARSVRVRGMTGYAILTADGRTCVGVAGDCAERQRLLDSHGAVAKLTATGLGNMAVYEKGSISHDEPVGAASG